jgi:hypothetical protein
MPLTKLQSHVLKILAKLRSPDSYIAGGIPLNRFGPRFSDDIDIFQDSEDRLAMAADADVAALNKEGLKLNNLKISAGKRKVFIEGMGEEIALEWVVDSDFRFFPTQTDEDFGYVLHPVDLATNKASAAADRRFPRDVVDLVTIHETILPLGAVISAAVGKFPGTTPEEMLMEITRHSRFTVEEFRVLATALPIDVPNMHKRIRRMIEDADEFISHLKSSDVGVVFLDGDKPVQPDLNTLNHYQRIIGGRKGIYPSSPDILTAMLEKYRQM